MLEAVAGAFPTVHQPDDVTAWLSEHGAQVSHVMTTGAVDAAMIAAMPNLRMIASYGVGYDHIDVAAAVAAGVVVTHTPDVLNAEVATTALMLSMACYRELLRDEAYVRNGRWASDGAAPLTRSLDRQVIGIVGLGRIGMEIVRKFAPFDPTILYHARNARDVDFEFCPDLVDMARRSDVLIVITPGGAGTRHLINAEVMAALGPTGTLINVARGTVVDEAAMIAALQSGALGWAGLDVFENEPEVPEALRALSNVVLLPHVGSATHETRAAMGQLVVDNLLSDAAGTGPVSAVPECADLAQV